MMVTTLDWAGRSLLRMSPIDAIHKGKQPRRPHFIVEWAEKRQLSQADLARELGADKSTVNRWFAGASPGTEWQEKLAALFDVEPEALFRRPEDNWMKRLFERHQKLAEILLNGSEEDIATIERLATVIQEQKRNGTTG